ncbi:natural cytotoxicity triggering receptor 3 ligand 1 isoform X2 [Zootoca vivipara]|uniref:natural cytotoxicity triggering receptor 3 ligand 1 isoform X2 n=1 Tax=Zootoca vivipara TaxID=8524 RepID=UPI00293C0058|nr:natural cytotoxicity triggering receptor 3 ligand 1 isoform X2 [Zootoca vivipara]
MRSFRAILSFAVAPCPLSASGPNTTKAHNIISESEIFHRRKPFPGTCRVLREEGKGSASPARPMDRGGGLAARRCLLLVFSVFLRGVVILQPAESLKVTMESRMVAVLDIDVMIPCEISEYSTPELKITNIAVEWYWKASSKEVENIVYTIVSGVPTSYRNGARMDESELKKGNAALFLPQIQISEEGIYRCSVTVTPVSDEGTTVLELIAQPSIKLSPRTVELENGKEKTLSCTVNKFYPLSIEVHWEKKSEHGNNEVVPADDICTGVPVKNGDGTFNVTSKLGLQPSLQDNGNVYSCVVGHKSFSIRQAFNATLIVTEPPPNFIWLAVILVLLLLGMIPVILYIKYFKKIQPGKFSAIKNKELKHLEETLVVFLLQGFRPKRLEIVFFLKLPSWNEKQEIYSWNTMTASNPEHGEDTPLIITGKGEESSDLVMKLKTMFTFDPTLQVKQRRTFDVSCSVNIVPDVKLLKEFELTLEVRHEAFPDCLSTETISFKVIECTPKVSKFECEPPVPECGKIITLSCLVEDFCPRECGICWLRGNNEPLDATSNTEKPQLDPVSNLYCKKSRVSFIPQPEDHAVDFIVQINHCQKVIRHSYPLLLKGYPKVTDITCEPNDPKYGTKLSLTCKVTDFFLSDIKIKWLDGGIEISEGVDTEKPVEGSNGCLKLSSKLQLIPTALDHNKFITFSVTYGDLKKPIVRDVYLKLPVHRPEMSEIKKTPMQNSESISLETVISNFAPCNIRVTWYEEWEKISEDNPRNIQIGENKLGYFVSKLQVSPKGRDSKETIRCEVFHQATQDFKEKSFVWESKDCCDSLDRMLTSPVSQNHVGPLINSKLTSEEPVQPMKIECVTSNPKAGEKVTLRCFVPGIRAEDANVSWFKGVYPVDDKIENANCGDGSGFISDVVITTEKDKKKYEIRCEVYVDANYEILEENFYLEL